MIEAEPAFDAFAKRFDAGLPQLVWTRRVSDLETPVSALLKIGADRPGVFLFESVEDGDWRGRYSIIGFAPDRIWRVRGGKAEISAGGFAAEAFKPADEPALDSMRRFVGDAALEIPSALPPMAAGVFGHVGYDMVRLIENLPKPPPDALGVPEAVLLRPTIVAIFDSVAQEIILVTPVRPGAAKGGARAAYDEALERLFRAVEALDSPPPRPAKGERPTAPRPAPQSNTTPAEYRAMVERAKAYTRAGDVFQVVPSQRFRAEFKDPPFALYRSLRRVNPSPFLFYIHLDTHCLVGSSPEILVRLKDGVVTIRPVAGTRPRGVTPAQDRALEEELLADPKERAEHLMLLDLGRNDVGRVAQKTRGGNDPAATGGVRVTQQFAIERASHVMHIVSNVEGRLAPGLDAVDALFAGFPAGTVSGAPKVRAMQIIDELEKNKRCVYAGGVGYFSAGGDMDTCIALRTAIVKDGVMYVQAGGGVVLDSDPEAELQETVHKSRALFRAADEAWRFV